MDIFQNMIREDIDENRKIFDKNCCFIVINMPSILILELSLTNTKSFNYKFQEIIKDIKKTNQSKIKKIYYFTHPLDKNNRALEIMPKISMYKYIDGFFPEYSKYFDMLEKHVFLYIVVEFHSSSLHERQDIIDLLSEHFSILLIVFKLDYSLFDSIKHKFYCDFHAICQGIYSSYNLNTLKQSFKKSDNESSEITIEDVPNRLTVKEFLEYVNGTTSEIFSAPPPWDSLRNFSLQSDLKYKNLREEYLAIQAYILHLKFDKGYMIQLGKETEKWDAKIDLDNTEVLVEVTQAIPKDEHIIRKELTTALPDYRALSLKSRTLHEEGMNSFPEPIITSIEKKHKKKYVEPRVLLVVVLAEFAHNNQYILDKWLHEIRNRTTLGNFKEIWLVVDAKKLYRIY